MRGILRKYKKSFSLKKYKKSFLLRKYKKSFLLRKYKKSFPLRKYKNFFHIRARKFNFPKYKEFFPEWAWARKCARSLLISLLKYPLKNLRGNLIYTYKVSHFYLQIIASVAEWFSLLSQIQQVTVRWACNFLGHIDQEIKIALLTNLQDYIELMLRLLCHLSKICPNQGLLILPGKLKSF